MHTVEDFAPNTQNRQRTWFAEESLVTHKGQQEI